ncbi:MAG TPA: SRPBCC domain-containing protein [Gemmatimonadaceae bacterium]|jgi:uncharacterized protein YndB with AHSA1/START domain
MSQISLIRRIAARPTIVFDALITADGIASWWGPDDFPVISAEADAEMSRTFRVRFRTVDGLEHECTGEFLQVKRPERVLMTWRWVSGGVPDERDRVSHLEFRLRAIDIGTELTLVHSGLSNDESARSHEGGWGGALEKLVRQFSADPNP